MVYPPFAPGCCDVTVMKVGLGWDSPSPPKNGSCHPVWEVFPKKVLRDDLPKIGHVFNTEIGEMIPIIYK